MTLTLDPAPAPAQAAGSAPAQPLADIAAAALALPPSERWPDPDWIARAADERGWTWARVAWRRAAAQPGAWFDFAKADRVVEHWPKWMRLSDDRFAGFPFHLLFWEEVILRLLVGWKRPMDASDPATGKPAIVNVRLFRQLRLWVPRKNGKTEFLAALAKLFFVHEPVAGGQGFAFARDVKQGRIVFEKIKTMIGYDPASANAIEVYKNTFYMPRSRSVFELLPGKAEGRHGLSPTVIVGDEMHEWASRALEDTLRQGTLARLQPIELYASTAGLKDNSVGVEMYEESRAILDGLADDPTTLVAIFALEADADPFDENNWRAANPSLGYSLTIDALRREAALAQGNPRKAAWFRCYHMGQWIDADVRWLPAKKWARCAGAKDWRTRLAAYAGRSARCAFDVGATQDIFALVWRFDDGAGGLPQFACRFWIPEGTLRARAESDKRTPWAHWAEIGAIETTPGDAVDQDFVRKAIQEGLALYRTPDEHAIGFDPWNATKLVSDMVKDGVSEQKFTQIRQGHRSLGEATKEFERRVFADVPALDHGGHPVLDWMARNAVVRFDENLNFVPSKLKSKDKIDGLVAAVMTEALAMAQPDKPVPGFVDV